MTKQSLVLITVAVLAAGMYVWKFTLVSASGNSILPQIRPRSAHTAAPPGDTAVYPVHLRVRQKISIHRNQGGAETTRRQTSIRTWCGT